MDKVWTEFNFITPNTMYKTKLGNTHDFKSWVNSGLVVDYITRPDKCVVFKEDENNYDAMKLLLTKEDKINWYRQHLKINQNSNQSGLYNLLDNDPKDVNLENVKNDLKNLKGNYWELIVNPGDLGLDNNVLCKDKWHEVLKPNFERFLKANSFDLENVNVFYSIHGNTDYPHVHMFWYEKEHKHKKAKLNLNSINVFGYKVGLSIKYDEDYQKINALTKDIWNTRKQIVGIIANNFANSNEIISKSNLCQEFIKSSKSILDEVLNKKNISYSRISDENKKNIETIKKFLLNYDNDYSKLFNSYQKQINDLNNLNIEDKFLKQRISKIINNEMDDFQKQVGNKIIKTLLNAYKQNNNAFTSRKNFASFFNEFLKIFSLNRSEWALRNLAEREFLAKDLKELELVEEFYRSKLVH
ncbi:hypothetical protein ACP0A6_02115 [Metamycoplasma hominis]|uniref:hypothetical protein n=1 Tax=Metamycoplasma hominis TaxID=2098 RepID=UPI003CE71B2B